MSLSVLSANTDTRRKQTKKDEVRFFSSMGEPEEFFSLALFAETYQNARLFKLADEINLIGNPEENRIRISKKTNHFNDRREQQLP